MTAADMDIKALIGKAAGGDSLSEIAPALLKGFAGCYLFLQVISVQERIAKDDLATGAQVIQPSAETLFAGIRISCDVRPQDRPDQLGSDQRTLGLPA